MGNVKDDPKRIPTNVLNKAKKRSMPIWLIEKYKARLDLHHKMQSPLCTFFRGDLLVALGHWLFCSLAPEDSEEALHLLNCQYNLASATAENITW